MKATEILKLKGEDLFIYFTETHPDKEYRSIVSLLLKATMSIEEAYEVLERCVIENKTLVAIYPMFDEIDTSQMVYIGNIYDGGLYLSDEPYFKDLI